MKTPKKNEGKPTGRGKGHFVEKNPMIGSKERSQQLNNLGKFGEVISERVHHITSPKNI